MESLRILLLKQFHPNPSQGQHLLLLIHPVTAVNQFHPSICLYVTHSSTAPSTHSSSIHSSVFHSACHSYFIYPPAIRAFTHLPIIQLSFIYSPIHQSIFNQSIHPFIPICHFFIVHHPSFGLGFIFYLSSIIRPFVFFLHMYQTLYSFIIRLSVIHQYIHSSIYLSSIYLDVIRSFTHISIIYQVTHSSVCLVFIHLLVYSLIIHLPIYHLIINHPSFDLVLFLFPIHPFPRSSIHLSCLSIDPTINLSIHHVFDKSIHLSSINLSIIYLYIYYLFI